MKSQVRNHGLTLENYATGVYYAVSSGTKGERYALDNGMY